MRYRFVDCEFDMEHALLHRAGQPIALQRQVCRVLAYLLERRGHLVSKDELAEHVWQAAISDATIESCIKKIRRAVGDTGRTQQVIATRFGYGYAFVAPVVAAPSESQEAMRPASSPSLPSDPPAPGVVASAAAFPVPAMSWTPASPEVSPGEKKVVSVLCCGIHTPAGRRPGEDLDRLHSQMRVLYRLVQQTVEPYGGTLQLAAGNRVLVWFGAPVAQEDHVQRAVLTTLGLYQRLSTRHSASETHADGALAVGLGLHTGEVAVGGIAEAQAMAAAVVGETALVAMALQELAEAGTILCSAAMARLARTLTDIVPSRPVAYAGQATPTSVYRILPRKGPLPPGATHRKRSVHQFVGREQELATLHLRLAHAAAGHGQVIGIVGEPGIGKSRLLDEFRQQLSRQPCTYIEGRCLSYHRETPYYPLIAVLRQACALHEMAPPRCHHQAGD